MPGASLSWMPPLGNKIWNVQIQDSVQNLSHELQELTKTLGERSEPEIFWSELRELYHEKKTLYHASIKYKQAKIQTFTRRAEIPLRIFSSLPKLKTNAARGMVAFTFLWSI